MPCECFFRPCSSILSFEPFRWLPFRPYFDYPTFSAPDNNPRSSISFPGNTSVVPVTVPPPPLFVLLTLLLSFYTLRFD